MGSSTPLPRRLLGPGGRRCRSWRWLLEHLGPDGLRRRRRAGVQGRGPGLRVTWWGVNNWRFTDVRAAIDVARRRGLVPPSFAQLKYGLARRSMAEGRWYGSLFEAGELALQASDVLEGGLLAGNLPPRRKIGADPGGIRSRIVAAWPQVERLARELDASPAQLGIAFCLANPATANVLVGVSRAAQLEDDVGALALLARIGADRLRRLTAQLWLDREVNADGT
jgi:aryl-alcohol dehydrogenase-like predicted oxidoreductase